MKLRHCCSLNVQINRPSFSFSVLPLKIQDQDLLTCSVDAVRPADDVGVSFVQLSHALHRCFTVIKLLDVPGVHRTRSQLHPTSILLQDDSVSPLDVNPGQHLVDQAVSFQ